MAKKLMMVVSDCVWKNGIRNFSSLVGEKVKEKEIMVYLYMQENLKEIDYKRLWNKKLQAPYKGKPKLEKRLDTNLELISSFVEKGVPKKQIIIPKPFLRWVDNDVNV